MHQPLLAKSLHQIYPDIEDELCSRHSTKFTQIKHKFQHLYSKIKPKWYVVGKGICQFGVQWKNKVNKRETTNNMRGQTSIAIENGVIITIAKTENKGNIYINYNKWQQQAENLQKMPEFSQQSQEIQQQLILNYKGQIQQIPTLSQNSKLIAKQLSLIYQKAIQDISLNKINGQIIYISSNLPQNSFYQKQALFYAFYVSILIGNQIFEEYDVRDIGKNIEKALRDEGFMSEDQYEKLMKYGKIFQYKNKCMLMSKDLVQFDSRNNKFLFVKLGEEINFKKNKNIEKNIINKLFQYQQSQDNQNDLSNSQSLLAFLKLIKQYFIQISKQSTSHSSIIQTIIKNINHLDGLFLSQNSQYLVLYVPNCFAAELVRKLAKQIKNNQNKHQNTDIQLNNKDLLTERSQKDNSKINTQYNNSKWGRNKNISQYIFSTLPSTGFNILDPKEEIWFNQ